MKDGRQRKIHIKQYKLFGRAVEQDFSLLELIVAIKQKQQSRMSHMINWIRIGNISVNSCLYCNIDINGCP
jgi:hypothetical protein